MRRWQLQRRATRAYSAWTAVGPWLYIRKWQPYLRPDLGVQPLRERPSSVSELPPYEATRRASACDALDAEAVVHRIRRRKRALGGAEGAPALLECHRVAGRAVANREQLSDVRQIERLLEQQLHSLKRHAGIELELVVLQPVLVLRAID